jgi:hypothetical protein
VKNQIISHGIHTVPELIFQNKLWKTIHGKSLYMVTMVTAYIDEEFKKIQQEEQGLGSGKVSDKTSKMSDKQLLVYSCAERFIVKVFDAASILLGNIHYTD